MARLKVGPGAKGWCAAPSDRAPFLQIDLGRQVVVTQLAVAGKSSQGIVTQFTLYFSEDGAYWRNYKISNKVKVRDDS